MKRALLFFSAIIAFGTVSAQERQASVVFEIDNARAAVVNPVPINGANPFTGGRNDSRLKARTSNTSTGRWYNYCDYLANLNGTLGVGAVYLWNDTTSLEPYGSPIQYQYNDLSSVGMVWDPFTAGWNDPAVEAGMINITPSDAYMVDSIFINGIYYRNNAKTAPVDTLTVAILYGDGTTPTDLHFVARDTVGGNEWIYNQYSQDTLFYTKMKYDSVFNRADTFNGGFAPVIKQIYLTNTDTSGNYQAVIPVSINLPAGNMPAISVSFKSGDASFTFGDTVFITDGTTASYKYGMFRPFVEYVESSPNTAIFPTNLRGDQNQGQFELLPPSKANHVYYPHWFLISQGGGASTWQYPYFAFHASCPTCAVLGADQVKKPVSAATAYPSPAGNELTITFNISGKSGASVSLTNMLGQVMASQVVNNSNEGQVSFNTSLFPAGIYFYAVQSEGQKYVNRIVIVH